MPRKRKLNKARYKQKKKLYHDLKLEQKIRQLRQERRMAHATGISRAEDVLMKQVAAYERAERIDALELKLMNFERKQVGLLPLENLPVDPVQMERAIDFERQRGRDTGRIGVRR